MDLSVNFLKKSVKKSIKPKSIFVWSFGSLVALYILAVLVILIFNLYLKTKSDTINGELSYLNNELVQKKDLESLNTYLAEKSESLEQVLGYRRQHHQITDYLFSILPEGVSIDGFSIGNQNELSFSGHANSLLALKGFLDNIESQKSGSLVISQATINGLSAKNDNQGQLAPETYNFSVYVSFLQ